MKECIEERHIYVIKKKVTVVVGGKPFEYDELLGKCTDCEEAKKILARCQGAFIAHDTVYDHSDLFRYE